MDEKDRLPDEEQEQERPRPRVVDKRIRTTQADAPAASAEAPPAATREHEPEPAVAQEAPGEAGHPDTSQGQAPQGDAPQWTPEQEAEARQMAAEIARTPSLDWVVNVAVTLANVAGTKLTQGAGDDARLAIDALGAIVEGLGPRLGDAEAPLRQTLADLKLAFAGRATL